MKDEEKVKCFTQFTQNAAQTPDCNRALLEGSNQVIGSAWQSTDSLQNDEKRSIDQLKSFFRKSASSGSLLFSHFHVSRQHLVQTLQQRVGLHLTPDLSALTNRLIFVPDSKETSIDETLMPFQKLHVASFLKPSTFTALLIGEICTPLLTRKCAKRYSLGLLLFVLICFETISGISLALNRVILFVGAEFVAALAHRQVLRQRIFLLSYLFFLALNPLLILELGFQLSFLAGLGIRYVFRLFGQRGKNTHVWKIIARAGRSEFQEKSFKTLSGLGELLKATAFVFFGSQLLTLPLILSVIGEFSLRSFVFQAMLFVFLPSFIVIGLCSLVFALVFPPALWLINTIFSGAAAFFLHFSTTWLTLPDKTWQIEINASQQFMIWVLLIWMIFCLERAVRQKEWGSSE